MYCQAPEGAENGQQQSNDGRLSYDFPLGGQFKQLEVQVGHRIERLTHRLQLLHDKAGLAGPVLLGGGGIWRRSLVRVDGCNASELAATQRKCPCPLTFCNLLGHTGDVALQVVEPKQVLQDTVGRHGCGCARQVRGMVEGWTSVC